MTYILKRVECNKKMTIKELKKIIFKSYYRQILYIKNIYCSMKHQKRKYLLFPATTLIEKYLYANGSKE